MEDTDGIRKCVAFWGSTLISNEAKFTSYINTPNFCNFHSSFVSPSDSKMSNEVYQSTTAQSYTTRCNPHGTRIDGYRIDKKPRE
jgi:hypothetical protein